MGKELIHQWTFKDPVSLPALAGAVSRTKAWELLPTGLRGWKETYLTSYTDFQLITALSCPTGSKVPSAGVENSQQERSNTAWENGGTGQNLQNMAFVGTECIAPRVVGKALKLNSNLTWFLFLLFGLLFCFLSFGKISKWVRRGRKEKEYEP